MKAGIVGPRGVGKSTLFSALTGADLSPSQAVSRRGIVDVVDPRLDHLRDVFEPKKFTRARFEIEDSVPLPGSDTKARGEVVAKLREPDVLMIVVGSFDQAAHGLPESQSDPAAQLSTFIDELTLLDLEAIEQRLATARHRVARGSDDRDRLRRDITHLEAIEMEVEAGELATSDDARRALLLSELRLFAAKPKIVIVNVDEAELPGSDHELPIPSITVCAPVEHEIAQMDEADRVEFLAGFGLQAPAADRLTSAAYERLHLISFFTVGEDEVRAWPLRRGSDAVTAAGKIHSDLARGFIRAEVTPYERVAGVRDPREFKERGAADLKGRDYIVRDGDALNIRFSI